MTTTPPDSPDMSVAVYDADSPDKAVAVYDADTPLSDADDVVELPCEDVVEDIIKSSDIAAPVRDDGDSPEPEIAELPSLEGVVQPSSPEIVEIPSSPDLPSPEIVEIPSSPELPFSPPPTPVPQPVPDPEPEPKPLAIDDAPEPEPKPLAIADAAAALVCLSPCSDSDLWACVRALRDLEAEAEESVGSGSYGHAHSHTQDGHIHSHTHDGHTHSHTHTHTHTHANAETDANPNTPTHTHAAHTNTHPASLSPSPTHTMPKLDKYQVDKYAALVNAEDEHNIPLRIGVMRLQNLVNGVDARLKRAGRFEEPAAKRRLRMTITNKSGKVGK